MPFTPKMRLFADEWLTGAKSGKRFSCKDAAEVAGYSTAGQNPYQRGSKLLRHPEIQKYIREQLDEYAMSATEVLLRFTQIARAEVGDVVTQDHNGRLTIDADAVINNKQFIKNFGFDSNGHPKIEFHDSMAALRDIARVRGMLKDGIEVTGPGGGAVPVSMTVQFVDADGGKAAGMPEKEEPDVPPEDFSDVEIE